MLRALAAVALATSLSAQSDRVPLGGPATVRDASPNAFSFPAPGLTRKERRAFAVGNAFFKDNWVAAPASTAGRDGLGPLFNARSCSACHFKDGRGRAPLRDEHAATGFLLRLGIAGEGPDRPHPRYGGQLQDRAIGGVRPEARVRIEHARSTVSMAGGQTAELLKPIYHLEDPAYGSIDGVRVGARVAQAVIGLGLLEAIPASAIEQLADPDDEDGDGISGRAHWLGEGEHRVLGRFGWKATQPTVRDQTAGAFLGDIGITSTLNPSEDLTESQLVSVAFTSGGEPELDDRKLGRVTFYSQVLAVPAQRDAQNPDVVRGENLFSGMGCASCHTPVQHTGDVACIESYRNVAFRPYTDLLLHDMGDGLADEKHDGAATPHEWRTPPLWGIGLFDAVNGHTRYLHDGRARNLTEAILWHGGESQHSREAFRNATAVERRALLAFLRSL